MDWPAVIAAFRAHALPERDADDHLAHQPQRANAPSGRTKLELCEPQFEEMEPIATAPENRAKAA